MRFAIAVPSMDATAAERRAAGRTDEAGGQHHPDANAAFAEARQEPDVKATDARMKNMISI